MPEAELVVRHASEVWAFDGLDAPVRGEGWRGLAPIKDGAVAVEDGRVVAVGTSSALGSWSGRVEVDARGLVVVPGFVDAHAHPLFAGHRAWELDAKLAGASYEELLAQGGGIHASVGSTRKARRQDLVQESAARCREAAAGGTTTMEAKSGYALTREGELMLLEAVPDVAREAGIRLVPTLLAGHAVPPERERDRAAFIEEAAGVAGEAASRGVARFVDAFIDRGALTLSEGRRVLEAGADAGLGLRVHADELTRTGATRLAVELEAASADHCNHVDEGDVKALAGSGTAAVLCPATPFTSQGSIPYAPARALLRGGCAVALGSDLNPNAWNESMVLTMRLAVHAMGMRPAEALAAATINAAGSLGLPDAGRLAPGARGDLVLLDGPTLEWTSYRFGRDPVRRVLVGGRDLAR